MVFYIINVAFKKKLFKYKCMKECCLYLNRVDRPNGSRFVEKQRC